MKGILKGLRKSKKTHVFPSEKLTLLPGSERKNPEGPKNEGKERQKLKTVAVKINHAVYSVCKGKQRCNSDATREQRKGLETSARRSIGGQSGSRSTQGRPPQLTDKSFKALLENSQYYEACLLICQSGGEEASEGRLLYSAISQQMWQEVSRALAGHPAALHSVHQCLQWAQECRDAQDPQWGPGGWAAQLEELLAAHIRGAMPSFAQQEGQRENLKNHLEETKGKILEVVSQGPRFPAEFTATYLKCVRGCLLDQLTRFTAETLPYGERVLLYKWAKEEHARLCKHLQGSADFDHMLFEKWFFNNGKKIESTGQETIQNELKDILQHEIVWNSYANLPNDRCYFYKIQEMMSSICEAVKDISATLLATMTSIFWEEFFKFLTRYEAFLKHKVDHAEGMTSGRGVQMGIRILHNSRILRDDILRRDDIQRISEMCELIDECEKKGTEIILRILRPKMKRAFKNYFKENKLDYENELLEYRDALRRQGVQNNATFNAAILHRITILYIQSFFKSKSRDKAEAFIKGSKKLKELFAEMVPDKGQLGEDPLEFMVLMLSAKDYESLQTTTIFFLDEHQDLRKEHVKAILDIKGGVKREERQKLLYYVENKKIGFGDCQQKYFEEVNIGCFNSKYFLCFQCLCA